MDKETTETPYYYAGSGNTLVYLVPLRRGVRVGMTSFGSEGESDFSCVMSREEFQKLLTDGDEVLRAVDALRDQAMRLRGRTRGNGGY